MLGVTKDNEIFLNYFTLGKWIPRNEEEEEEMGQATMTENEVLIVTSAGDAQGERSNVTRREKNGSSSGPTVYFPPVSQVCAEL